MLYKKISIQQTPDKGRGLFASEEIKKGEKILKFEGPIVTLTQAVAKGRQDHVFPIDIDKYLDLSEPEELINHSCDPNTGFLYDDTLIAIKDIMPNEELTFDYSLVTLDDWKMDCNCGSKLCRKKVGNFTDLSENLKEKYKDLTPQWVLKEAGKTLNT